jgi:thymidylate kinase
LKIIFIHKDGIDMPTYPNKKSSDGKAVIFFGVDGVGKTTQANLLAKKYWERGDKVSKAWLRGRHTLAYLVSKLLLKIGYSHIIKQGDIEILDPRGFVSRKFWSFLEFVSVVPLILLRMSLPLLLGYVVIAERFIVDTVVFNSFYIGKDFKPYIRILLRFIPRKAVLIHLDADWDELRCRRAGDWPEDFIKYQLNEYRLYALRFRALTINTTRNPVDVTQKKIGLACKING